MSFLIRTQINAENTDFYAFICANLRNLRPIFLFPTNC